MSVICIKVAESRCLLRNLCAFFLRVSYTLVIFFVSILTYTRCVHKHLNIHANACAVVCVITYVRVYTNLYTCAEMQ